MLYYCELFPSHNTAVSENYESFRLLVTFGPQGVGLVLKSSRLEPKFSKGHLCFRSRCENLCPTLLVDLSPLAIVVGQSDYYSV